MKDIFTGTESSARWSAMRLALVYAVVGFLWILLSDRAVLLLLGHTPAAAVAQTIKGWLFIAFTALVVYALTNRTIGSIQKSEAALCENQRVLSTLLGNLPGMAYSCRADPECTIEFVSAGSLELTGYGPEELITKTKITDLILEEDRERVRLGTAEAMAGKRPFKLAFRIRHADGTIRWVMEQGRGVYSPSGQLDAMEGFITDITERKKAEDALIRSEEIYRALVEGTSDAILMVDNERKIISVNRAFSELFGYTRDELAGQSVRVVHPSDESFNEFGGAAYPTLDEAPMRIESDLKRRDGTIFPVEGTYSAIKGPDGSKVGHVGIIRDITQRKKTEQELREYHDHLEEMVRSRTRELEEAQRALVQKEKLKTLGAIAAEVAHEIRNPLVSIGGFARRLHRKQPDSMEARIILQESQRLESILNRITYYLRPTEVRSQECYVNSILSESLDLLAPELEKEHIRLQLDLDPHLSSAHVDPDILAQVFVTLIRNAVNTMDSDRELLVRTYDREQAVCVDFRSRMAKKIDDPELMLLPFDTDEEVPGLSSSFKLLKGMGGTLSFVELDHLAVFTVSLVKCTGLEHCPAVDEKV